MKDNDFLKSIQLLDRAQLKLIAVVSMLIDHVGAVFFENAVWMRCVGRLAMPIFCFFIAEGYFHTRDRKKYLLRIGLFALIAEIPFDLAFYDSLAYWGHQNVMCTFFLAILAMLAFDECKARWDGKKGLAFGTAAAIVLALAATLAKTDYGAYGVALVFLFYIMRERGLLAQVAAALMYMLFTRNVGISLWAMASAVPILMYNGEKGRSLKWFFYCFYPGHLLIIGLISHFII